MTNSYHLKVQNLCQRSSVISQQHSIMRQLGILLLALASLVHAELHDKEIQQSNDITEGTKERNDVKEVVDVEAEERGVNWGKERPGPLVYQTHGQPWPKPQRQTWNTSFMIVRPSVFQFQVTDKSCDILKSALKRYYKMIFSPPRMVQYPLHPEKPWKKDPLFRGYLDTLKIDLAGECEQYPYMDMDEHYEIKIDTSDLPRVGLLTSQSIWGILRGLETFSQLLYQQPAAGVMQINSTLLMDFPRFSHRGILVDTSRHYLSIAVIKDTIELMAQNKFNVFHWHIVDDNSFPYESITYPSLSKKGAYNPYTHVYTQEDIKGIIEFARQRGIRVLAEFDTPGHTQSWELGHAGLLTPCYTSGKPDGTYGPIDPTKTSTYDFLQKLFQEVVNVFPDKYVHLGGDEVSFTCWQSNPNVTAFMKLLNITGNYAKLEQYYMQKLLDIVAQFSTHNGYIVWQEVVDNGVKLKPDTVVHVWMGNEQQYMDELKKVTALGFRTLLSSPWYLNYISYGRDWDTYYKSEPQGFNGTDAQKKLVIGGEVCMWGEFVDSTNLTPRTWPRASAVAERLWSNIKVKDISEATSRLEEHRCRMLSRGYNVQPPSGPSYCEVVWDR